MRSVRTKPMMRSAALTVPPRSVGVAGPRNAAPRIVADTIARRPHAGNGGWATANPGERTLGGEPTYSQAALRHGLARALDARLEVGLGLDHPRRDGLIYCSYAGGERLRFLLQRLGAGDPSKVRGPSRSPPGSDSRP